MTVKNCRVASISTMRDSSISVVLHVDAASAVEAFDLHPFKDQAARVDFWVSE